jgi:hypothetical protein
MATIFGYKTAADQPAFSVETPTRAFEQTRPYPQNSQIIIYRTRFMQLRAYYSRPTANTPHPNLPQVYFADDVDFQDRLGGLVEWTRVYTTLPTSWNDFSSDVYNYPGFQGTLYLLGRNPFSHIVTTKEVKDYYMVGNTVAFSNLLTSYDNLNASPWSLSGATSTGNYATIPVCAGATQAAARITESTGNSQHYVSQSATTNVGLITGSVFVKAGDNSRVDVGLYNGGQGTFANVSVDLEIGQPLSDQYIYGNGWGIASVGDGWWRINVTGTAASSPNQLQVRLLGVTGNPTYTGTATSLYAWRGQLVAGNTAPYATVPPTVAGDGTTSYPITQVDKIPVKFGTRYLYQTPWGYGSSTTSGQFVAEYLSDGGFGLVATSPTLSDYNGYVTADSANGNSNSYSIESQDSVLSLWYGSIWERQRKFVKAI